MDLTYTASEAAFREELRTWLTQNPVGQKPSWDDGLIEWLIAWQGRLYDAGWAAVQWPTEHGGRNADAMGNRGAAAAFSCADSVW